MRTLARCLLPPDADPVILQLVLQHLDDELGLVQLTPHPPVLGGTEVSPEDDLTNLSTEGSCACTVLA